MNSLVIIKDQEEYEMLKAVSTSECKLEDCDHVAIPLDVFNHLMLLDKAVEDACKEVEG